MGIFILAVVGGFMFSIGVVVMMHGMPFPSHGFSLEGIKADFDYVIHHQTFWIGLTCAVIGFLLFLPFLILLLG